MKTISSFLLGVTCASLVSGAAFAQSSNSNKFLASKQFGEATKYLAEDFDNIVKETINLTEIPAPPFKETERGKYFQTLLQSAGLEDVETDAVGNVMGIYKGKKHDKVLVVAAHLDTVFPAGTDVKVKIDGNKYKAPGIGDDTVSLAVMVSLIKAIKASGIQTQYDILFVGNVGEEGPGNLRGTKYLFNEGKYKGKIKSFISLEPGAAGDITDAGIGSKRYKVDFNGPGGHSFGDFGIVSPAYAMADAITKFTEYPSELKNQTTYNVGIVEGGTSVNSIPFKVSMTVDMRSASADDLKKLDDYFVSILPKAVENENSKRSTRKGEITFKANIIGERPVGKTAHDTEIFKITEGVYKKFGYPLTTSASSTDSNVPMSLGIPALTLGSGIESFNAHSPEEYLVIEKEKNLKAIAANLAIVVLNAN